MPLPPGLETAALTLGTAVVRGAAKLWLGDHQIAADAAASAIDVVSGRAEGLIRKRQVRRMFDQLAETVATKLAPLIEAEFRGLPENELQATVEAVRDTFERAALEDKDLFAADLNARYLDGHLRSAVPDVPRRHLLSRAATGLYDRMLLECSEYLIQVTKSLPSFQPDVLTELLRRDSEIIETLNELLARLPDRAGDTRDFEQQYRNQLINVLDHMELFGATLSEASRRYPLRLAYMTLSVTAEAVEAVETDDPGDPEGEGEPIDATHVLASSRRLFVRGGAGNGKTTLLKWVAVRTASRKVPDSMAELRDVIGFFIPLRHYVDDPFPPAGRFVEHVGRHMTEEMPRGWVQRRLRGGRAIVLIDGVDELPPERREDARAWLRELVITFPGARYIVTSRPGAAVPGWLAEEGFDTYRLEPMRPEVIRQFVAGWHEAVLSQNADTEERARIEGAGRRLAEEIAARRHLRQLAETPLLCALLCALHRDRHGQIPQDRMELYAIALEMLLERRGADQRIAIDTMMPRTKKTLLLQDIAYWLIRNGWSDADRSRVIERIAPRLGQMSIESDGEEVYQHLLERSGLIREPVVGRVDFIHRTFQEYLAALEALAVDDIGLMVSNAHLDQWREVVIMAAGHAYLGKREELLGALLERGAQEPEHREALDLLAVACLETSPELPRWLHEKIRRRMRGLIPPKTMSMARTIAAAGDFVVDLLDRARPGAAREVAATIRAAAEIGGPAALKIVQRFASDSREPVIKELLRSWAQFDPEEYARLVLRGSPADDSELEIDDPSYLPALRYLRNLRSLNCGGIVLSDLAFLAELPGLETLTNVVLVEDSDLRPLAESRIGLLNVQVGESVDLAPLGDIPFLRELVIDGAPVDLAPLGALTGLEELYLYDLVDAGRLARVARLTGLKVLVVTGVAGAKDLAPLSFLRAPRTLGLAGWRELSDLSGVERWAGSLTSLSIAGSAVTDLRPLTRLPHLERLDITAAYHIVDFSPIADMPSLTALRMDGSPRSRGVPAHVDVFLSAEDEDFAEYQDGDYLPPFYG